MDILERLVAALEGAEAKSKSMHTKAPASVNTSTLLTQPGGIFSVAGIENDVISTHMAPEGLGAFLPSFPSAIDDPRFGLLTGFTATTGSEPTNPCDDAPAGFMKSGTLTSAFGRVQRQTQTIEIDKLLHQQRGANTDLRLMGQLLGMSNNMHPANLSQADILDMVVKAEMVGVGVQMERKLSTMVWTGTPSNNTAGGGYKEFPGLDNQIATGQVDAETGTAITAADSDIKDFNYAAVDGTTRDIVEYVSMVEYYLRDTARRTGMLPTTWAIAMRPELWFELSAVWPCRYLTHRCTTDTNTNPVVINDNVNVAMRDAMREGMYLDVNGRRYPVVIDDGINEQTNITDGNVPAGSYASSLYFVPLRVRGNFPVTYWEFIDYRGIQAQISAMGAGARNVPFWSDNGRFLWVYRDNGYCFDLQAKIEPRVVLRTPHLAGKIQNILYTPLQHLKSPYPSNPYHVDGGISLRSATTGQAVWA